MSAVQKPLARIEAQYRRATASRWAGLVIRAALFDAAVLLVVPGLLISRDTSILAITGTLLAGPAIYLLTTHLVLRARRAALLAPPRSTALSPSLFATASVAISANAAYLLAHAVCGLAYALAYAALLNFRAPDTHLGVFAPTARHPWHINERLYFLVLGNTLLFTLLGAKDVLSSALAPVWSTRRTRFADAVKQALGISLSAVAADLTLGAVITAVYPLVYFALRRTVWRLTVSYLPFLRPFIFNFSRPAAPVALTYHLAVLALTAALAVRVPAGLVGTYLTEPLRFDALTRASPLSPDQYLLAALQTADPYYLNLTIQEVQRVAHLPARRKALFADLSRSPAPLHELWRALLLELARAHAAVAPPRAALAARPAPAAAPDRHTLAPKQADIFRPATRQKSILQLAVQSVVERPPAAAAPQPLPAALAAGQARAAAGAKLVEGAVARRVEGPVRHAEDWARDKPAVSRALSLYSRGASGAQAWARRTWTARAARARVPEPDRVSRLVDIFATLAVASIDEDTYGLVQAVLPGTLEALVRLRTALSRTDDGLARVAGGTPAVAVGRVVGEIDAGVRRIADAFGHSLTAFRFPPAIAQSLTDICR